MTTVTERIPYHDATANALLEAGPASDPSSATWPTASRTATIHESGEFRKFTSGGLDIKAVLEALRGIFIQEVGLFSARGDAPDTHMDGNALASVNVALARRIEFRRHNWQSEITTAKHPRDIAMVLRCTGLDSVADEITRLLRLAANDPEEPEMQMDSLRALATFLVEDSWLPNPVVGVSYDGLLTAEWRVIPSGGLLMKFLPEGEIRYAGVVGVRGAGGFQSLNGGAATPRALQILRSFAVGLTVQ